jgi:FlaG/FlaF family flagellin (archaellin)
MLDSILPEKLSLFDSVSDNRGLSTLMTVIILLGLVILVAGTLSVFLLGSASSLDRAPQIDYGVQDATDAASDEILIDHGGGPEMHAEDTMIKIKRGGNTLVTLEEGQDVSMSVGDTMKITSDGSSTTINFAGDKAFSSDSAGFNLNNGGVKVLIIDKNSNREIASLMVEA